MLQFVKMHGLGNDYVYADGFRQALPEETATLESWSRVLSDRHFGIGSDGLILILPSETHDFRMRMFNADGTEGKMCGNGIRCVAKYVWDEGLTERRTLRIETLSGTIRTDLILKNGEAVGARVDMGEPALNRGSLPMTGDPNTPATEEHFVLSDGTRLTGTGVSLGNPHVVFFVDDVHEVPLQTWGPELEHDARFPERTNVEFVKVLEPGRLRMRVWERGSGVTLACGTGACASVVASHVRLGLPRQAEVVLDGGLLAIDWSEEDNHVYMTGPAETVFRGSCDVESLLESAGRR